jgi:hypothetical protein
MTATHPLIAEIGILAWRALAASEGRVALLAATGGGVYLEAGHEILWASSEGPLSHARALRLAGRLPDISRADDWRGIRLALPPLEPWSPALPERIEGGMAALAGRAAKLAATLLAAEAPRGMGVWLAGGRPGFPLEAVGARIEALLAALGRDDRPAGREALGALIGLGQGLTPSGDDLVAGLLMARHIAAIAEPARSASAEAWAALVREAAAGATNRISECLLADASRGSSFAPLHALCSALAAAEEARAEAAALSLLALGQSSGWDLFAGLCAGLLAPAARQALGSTGIQISTPPRPVRGSKLSR